MSTFTAPIGSDEERKTGIIWPGHWADSTPYLTHYAYGFHTGADLNLNYPHWDADAHSAVYAIGDGVVTYAQLYSRKVWGNIIVIDHGIVDGKPLFSRYAHVDNIKVAAGQLVTSGDLVANVGNGEGLFPFHLHFDISTAEQLRTTPNDWPQEDKERLKREYVDPKRWLQEHVLNEHVVSGIIPPAIQPEISAAQVWYVIARFGVRVRKNHGTAGSPVGSLLYGAKVSIEVETVNQDDYTWGQISAGEFKGDWFAIGKADQSDTFVSGNPPA